MYIKIIYNEYNCQFVKYATIFVNRLFLLAFRELAQMDQFREMTMNNHKCGLT